MTLQRDVDGLDESVFSNSDSRVDHQYFVKIESDPDTEFGILRYTTREHDWDGILDAAHGEDALVTWRGGEFTPEDVRVSQTNDSALEVSSVTFGDAETDGDAGPWLNLDITYGLKNRRISVWQVWMPDTAAGERDVVAGKYLLFVGRIGARDHSERSTFSLLPFRSSWNMLSGSRVQPTVCRFAIAGLFKDAHTCQYAGGGTTCDGALTTCQGYDNEINFGGHPLMLKPNTTVTVGTQRFQVG